MPICNICNFEMMGGAIRQIKSDYVVAIPSYDRVKMLLQDTLPTLLRQGVPPSKINIFVANKEQEELYKTGVPKKSYNNIIVGVKGLDKQLQFIKDYYSQGTNIIILLLKSPWRWITPMPDAMA